MRGGIAHRPAHRPGGCRMKLAVTPRRMEARSVSSDVTRSPLFLFSLSIYTDFFVMANARMPTLPALRRQHLLAEL